jgi:hypothetical protein
MEEKQGAAEGDDIERLPADLLAHALSLLPSFRDLSMYEENSSRSTHQFWSALILISSAFEATTGREG